MLNSSRGDFYSPPGALRAQRRGLDFLEMGRNISVYKLLCRSTLFFRINSKPISLEPENDIVSPHDSINYQADEEKENGYFKIPAVPLVAFSPA